MSEEAESNSVEAALELTRWGTRFVNPDVEGSYRVWHVRTSRRHIRAAVFTALTGYVLFMGAIYLVARDRFVASLALGVTVVLPGALMFGRRMPNEWVLRSITIMHAWTGLVTVGMCILVLKMPDVAAGATASCVFIGLVTFRLRLAQGVAAVLPYVLFLQILLLHAYIVSGVPVVALTMYSTIVWVAVWCALPTCVVLERGYRQTYRQERTIEAQKETIARERARSEALLKKEVSYQVAARSRELGEALARNDSPTAITELAPGDRFDVRYRITRALGAGAMGAVYEVERLTDAQHLALKVMTGSVSAEAKARFAREAEIGAATHHENLVSIVDVGVAASGAPFLVMELVSGGSLEDHRTRFGRDVAWARDVLLQIGRGLAALHAAGVVHRDLKPANVLLHEKGGALVVKVSDFGISRFGANDDETANADAHAATMAASKPRVKGDALTGTGMFLGTPIYMAPEAARGGRAADAPSDVFAFGIVAYEMLTGRAPFKMPPVILAMAQQPVPAPEAIADAGIAPDLARVVLACLATDPVERPRMRAVLESIANSA